MLFLGCLFLGYNNSYAHENDMHISKINYYNSKEKIYFEGEDIVVKPEKTTIIKASRKYASYVELKWKKIRKADGYCIYRSKEKSGRYKRVAEVSNNRYVDKVKSKEKYYYKVRVYVNNGEARVYSDYSNIMKVSKTIRKKVNRLSVVDINKELYTYREMEEDINILKEKYPDYFTYKIAGRSYDGRNIYIICLGNKNAEKEVLIQSTIHGREYMNSAICMAQLEYYLNNWNAMFDGKYTYGELFNKTCVYIMPMLNPDGVAISQFGYNSIKNEKLRNALKEMSGIENYKRWKSNARGVDLNRNFSTFWSKDGEIGSSFYSGRKPDSERETRIIKKIINKHDFEFVISYHSMGNRVYWDIGQSGEIYNATYKLARKISNITGYPLGEKSEPEGLSYNWTIYEKNIPEIIIENGFGVCPLPVTEYKKTWKVNKELIPKIIR